MCAPHFDDYRFPLPQSARVLHVPWLSAEHASKLPSHPHPCVTCWSYAGCMVCRPLGWNWKCALPNSVSICGLALTLALVFACESFRDARHNDRRIGECAKCSALVDEMHLGQRKNSADVVYQPLGSLLVWSSLGFLCQRLCCLWAGWAGTLTCTFLAASHRGCCFGAHSTHR